jgi:hypothetical protein
MAGQRAVFRGGLLDRGRMLLADKVGHRESRGAPRSSQKLLLLQNQQVLKSVWLKLFVCTLQHLHIGPRLSRQSSRVLTPQMRGAILIRDVDILKALGLRDIVNAGGGARRAWRGRRGPALRPMR